MTDENAIEGEPVLACLDNASQAATVNPLDFATYTALQEEWIRMAGPRLLLRAANQIGKSHATAAKMGHFIRRTGPYANRRAAPVRVLVISTSKEQIVPLMEKMRDLFPPGEVCRDLRNDRGRVRITPLEFVDGLGFTGKPPRIYWHTGPAKGSTITFATYKQGAGRIAGGTFDLVVCDEPLPKEIWDECQPRVMHKKGAIWVTFTPTPECCDVAYLRKLVADGLIKELHAELTVETKRLRRRDGGPGRALMTQAEIDVYAASILPIARDMRVKGSWDIVVTDRHFMGWGEHCLAGDRDLPPPGSIFAIGMDHGLTTGRQAAALIAICQNDRLMPEVWVLGEYRPEGYAVPETVARGILRMIDQVGRRLSGGYLAADGSWLGGVPGTYDDLHKWYGDRAAVARRGGIRMENSSIRRFIAKQLGRDVENLKEINTPIKYGGSSIHGEGLLNAMMARRKFTPGTDGDLPNGPGYFRVWRGCTHFIADVAKYKGAANDPAKDLMDAVRYPAQEEIDDRVFSGFRMIYA